MSMLTLADLTTKQTNQANSRTLIGEYLVPPGKVLHILPHPAFIRLVAHEVIVGPGVNQNPVALAGDIVDSPDVAGVGEALCYLASDNSVKALASIDFAANTITPVANWAAVNYDVFYLFGEGYLDFKVAKPNENGVSILNERVEDIHIRKQYTNDTAIRLNSPVPIPEYYKLQLFIKTAREVRWDNYAGKVDLAKPLLNFGIPYQFTQMPKGNDAKKFIEAVDARLA